MGEIFERQEHKEILEKKKTKESKWGFVLLPLLIPTGQHLQSTHMQPHTLSNIFLYEVPYQAVEEGHTAQLQGKDFLE